MSTPVMARANERDTFAPHGRCPHCAVPFDVSEKGGTICRDCAHAIMVAERAKLAAARPAPVPNALAANLAARRFTIKPSEAQGMPKAIVDLVEKIEAPIVVGSPAIREASFNFPEETPPYGTNRATVERIKAKQAAARVPQPAPVPVKRPHVAIEKTKAEEERERLMALVAAHHTVDRADMPENVRATKALEIAKAWLALDPVGRRFMLIEID